MTVNNVRSLNWITLEDWSKIPATSRSGYISEDDMYILSFTKKENRSNEA